MIQYLQNNVAVIQAALSQHVFLALVPVLIGIVVSLPIGYLAVRFGFLVQPIEELEADAIIDHYDALIPALERLGA